MINNTVLNQLPQLQPKAHVFTGAGTLEQPALPTSQDYITNDIPAAKPIGGTLGHHPYLASLVYGTDERLEYVHQTPPVTT